MSNRRSSKDTWKPDFPSAGMMKFLVDGYVQKVNENEDNEQDYLTFYIDNPFKAGNTNTILIEYPWCDELPMLEVGAHVEITGNIRSWWNSMTKKTDYSFIAESCEFIAEEKKSRRGKE